MKIELLQVLIISLVTALFIVLFKLSPLTPLTLILFIGIAMVLAAGVDKKKIKNYIASGACGLFWGWVLLQLFSLTKMLAFNEGIALYVVFFVFIFTVKSIHSVLLKKTWFNHVGFIFAGVIGVVYAGTDHLPGIFIALSCGILIGFISILCATLLIKDKQTK